MININNLFNNENIKLIASGGQYFVYEHQKDLSVSPWSAVSEYFMKEMNCKKRQVLVQLNNSACKTQAGAMQWVAGNIQTTSGVTGVGNFLGKMVKGAVTGESGVKPEYTGQGFVMLEPTYNYILIEDIAQWGPGVVLDDGLFLCCDMSLQESITKRSNVSSAVLGGEGLFNLTLSGQGYAVLESPVPREELIEFNLENDVLKHEKELTRLRTDHVDYYLMHHLTDVAMWEKLKDIGILEWIQARKKESSIRNIGWSFIQIKGRSTHPRRSMNFSPCITSITPCRGQEHRLTMQRWKQLTAG